MILGIDLGTTNSACAVWRDGRSELIPNRHGELLTPSVVSVDAEGGLLVGRAATERLFSHPGDSVAVFKRYMGSEHSVRLGKRSFSAPELSALVLASLKQDAEAHLGEAVDEAVISVPAYFNDAQRKATRLAGELAGLKVERLINEPTAAAMAYGLHEGRESRFIVLDLGGGTFDVSIMEYFEGVLEVHASAGDNHLGGEDFLELLVREFLARNGIDGERLELGARQTLHTALEYAKRRLSTEATVTLNGALPQQAEPFELSRDGFAELVQPLLARIQLPVERALLDAGIAPHELDDVILVGGATRMQVFRSMVAKMFRRMPSANLDPDLVVAIGAGIQAGLKARDAALDDVVLTDVAPYSLGVGVVNKADSSGVHGDLFQPVIERNTVVPVSIEHNFCTVQDRQKQIDLNVYQGESRLVRNNVFLGHMMVKVPAAAAGKETVSVRFSYDMNGLLEVDVTVDSTGQRHSTVIENSPGELTAEQIGASRRKLAALKFHPRDDEANRALITRAERLFESSLGERREYIGNLLRDFEVLLERQSPGEIRHAQRELGEILEQLESTGWF